MIWQSAELESELEHLKGDLADSRNQYKEAAQEVNFENSSYTQSFSDLN